jgi:anthranilate synthase/aminodeoxychorismate synthase-like glutamine amidotransferase
MILVIDNYDSFTFNLVQLVRGIAARERSSDDAVSVVRNDVEAAPALLARAGGVLLSPGPGLPHEAGVCLALVREAPPSMPIFGVCLGMQILAEAHGARVVRAPRTMHGRTSTVRHDGHGAFSGVPASPRVMRYHSWVVEEASLGGELVASAWSEDDGTLMAMRHRTRPIEAVQFHPE